MARNSVKSKAYEEYDTESGFEQSGEPQDERRHMIAEAAYFRAEHRGFAAGSPVEDWLLAEREIDEMMRGGRASAAQLR